MNTYQRRALLDRQHHLILSDRRIRLVEAPLLEAAKENHLFLTQAQPVLSLPHYIVHDEISVIITLIFTHDFR